MFSAIKRILRVGEQFALSSNVRRDTAMPEEHLDDGDESNFLRAKIGNRVVGEMLSSVIFGIGMLFIATLTAGLAIYLQANEGKLMFGTFAVVCLLVAVRHIDVTTRWIRKSSQE